MTKTRVFLSYSRIESKKARRLYNELKNQGMNVWFDEESLLGGQNWKDTISREIRGADYFVVLLSKNSVGKRGYLNAEILQAIEVYETVPANVPYLIQVRLDRCEPSHERLKDLNRIDLFPWKKGVAKLLRSLSATKNARSAKVLRTDGLYVAMISETFKYYHLRFFADKTVVATSSNLTPANIVLHMTKDNPHMSIGRYSFNKNKIKFSTISGNGVVEYEGYIDDNHLILKKSSNINGHRDVHEYLFKSLAALAT